jgi:hypothetical protein
MLQKISDTLTSNYVTYYEVSSTSLRKCSAPIVFHVHKLRRQIPMTAVSQHNLMLISHYTNIIIQHPVAFKHFSHSILQSLMQLSVYQFYISTTCFGHIGPSSGTITIVAKAVSL